MSLEVSPEEGIVFSVESFGLLKPPHSRYLLCQGTMQRGIDAMRLDRHRY
jgi:hypothetical protein